MSLAGRPLNRALGGLLVVGALGAAAYYWGNGLSDAAVTIDYRDANTVALGRALYAQHCADCHGEKLEGEVNWQIRDASGRLPAPPHDESGHTWHHSDQQLFELTKYGPIAFVGGNYESNMPGFEHVLDDREILGILAFIKSSWPEVIRRHHNEINQRAQN